MFKTGAVELIYCVSVVPRAPLGCSTLRRTENFALCFVGYTRRRHKRLLLWLLQLATNCLLRMFLIEGIFVADNVTQKES